MNTDTIAMTTRDQIALDIYIRALLTRSGHSKEECAKVAYQAADVFIAEQRQQEKPQAPALPTLENRKTVTPEVGKRYFMRNGDSVKILPSYLKATPFVGVYEGRLNLLYLPDGRHESNPQHDLVSEVPA